MRPDVALKTTWLLRGYGTVKWFGGVNKKTGRENHFGFLEDLNGNRVFVHESEWWGTIRPDEGDRVTYLEEQKDGQFSARRAERLDVASIGASECYSALCAPPLNTDKFAGSRFREAVGRRLQYSLADSGPEDLRLLIQMSQQPGTPSIFGLVSSGIDAARNYGFLLEATGLCITDQAPWAALSPHVASHFETEIAVQLVELEHHVVRDKCAIHLTVLPSAVLTYLLTRGVFTTTAQLGSIRIKQIYDYVSSAIIHRTDIFPSYLQASFDTSLVAHGVQSSNPILRDIFDNLLFKKSLFDKNNDFINIYDVSARLHGNVETFILYNLLALIVAGNDHEVVHNVFMQRLWEALTSKALSFERQTTKLQSLFPGCTTMGPTLSCEAVHWPKQNIFLCRGKVCDSPQVLPESTNHFLNFNIYDWLNHYGIDYTVSDKPQTKDFPIKLASFFNRLREILPLLHCRSCDDLMLPNMKYARTQYKELVKGIVEVKDMAAAYRLTVFHCNNADCEEVDVDHYISHCLGFGCHHIIDSRDLKKRCSRGRYICKCCGSCCSNHAQLHPVGLCAECGCELEVLSETVRGRQTTYSRNYVKCKSASCNFMIPGEDLPAKFKRVPAKNATENTDTRIPFDLALAGAGQPRYPSSGFDD